MEATGNETVSSELDLRQTYAPRAEILVVACGHRPANQPLYPEQGSIVRVGRRSVCDLVLEDEELSGDHFGIVYVGDGAWRVTDYGSKNGTFVNGVLVRGGSVEHVALPRVVVRAGGTVIVLGSFAGLVRTLEVGELVIGPAVAAAHFQIANFAAEGMSIVIEGETGSGKEAAAHVAHRHGRNKRGPFIAENCSKITESLAESTLFGVSKGAVASVAAQNGLFGDADGGTLFLDEVHKLPSGVQSTILRVVQDGTLRTVGGVERKVNVRLVCATNRSLREEVAAGRFAADLYARIAQATVVLPPLRERPDEIPHLAAKFAGATPVHADFIEAALLRPWPGNVRELYAETLAAAVRARSQGGKRVRAGDLAPSAGMPIGAPVLSQVVARVETAPVVEKKNAQKLEVTEPLDERWPILKEQYLATRNLTHAARVSKVALSTAHRWLEKAGLIEK